MASHVQNLFFWQKRTNYFRDGSVILITGAGSGIGQALALVYAQRNCTLVLADISAENLQETERQCRVHSPDIALLACKVDVTSFAQCTQWIDTVLTAYHRIDILILCAGIGAHHVFAQTSDLSLFHRLMAVNFYGYLHCVKAAHDSLCASNGQLVAITSFSGEVGLPYRTAYCASKFAVTGLLEALRSEMEALSVATTVASSSPSFDSASSLPLLISSSASHHQNNSSFTSESSSSASASPNSRGKYAITIVCPPTVNTNLRKNSLTPDLNLKDAPPSSTAMSVTQCAEAIVDAADRRLRKAFFPFNSWLASYLRPMVPDIADAFILKRAKL